MIMRTVTIIGDDMKYSKQREMILQIVVNNPIHPTADEVYAQVHALDPLVSMGTVYRNLNLLSEIGKLRKIEVPSGSDRFDGRTDRHFHLICRGCKSVVDVEYDDSLSLEQDAEQQTGYKVDEIDIVMRGICPQCDKNR